MGIIMLAGVVLSSPLLPAVQGNPILRGRSRLCGSLAQGNPAGDRPAQVRGGRDHARKNSRGSRKTSAADLRSRQDHWRRTWTSILRIESDAQETALSGSGASPCFRPDAKRTAL